MLYLLSIYILIQKYIFLGSIRKSCHTMKGYCHDRPCMHGGSCTEGWNRYICDCSQTSFSGATCGNCKFVANI